jgi:hypothetical protein
MISLLIALIMLAGLVASFSKHDGVLFWVFFTLKFAAYCGVMIMLIPRLTRWFLRRYSDAVMQFIFVLSMLFMSAALSQIVGIEGVFGAFFAGLILNRYIPHVSPLMNRLEFIGNALFIPYFLIGVGMLININLLFQGSHILWVVFCIAFFGTLGKAIAAYIACLGFRLPLSSGHMMFGLTSAHAAGSIADERFLRLIRKFLNAGYVEDWVFHRTYSGTPQGGIISPILANIYLDKFDKYIKEYINRFNKGVTRKGDARYKLYEQRRYRLAKKLKNEKDVKVRKQMTAEIKRLREERNNYPARNEMDSSIKRLKYVRYADDFLIGITGNLEDCKTVKEDIKNYLNEALKLELSDEKTLITNAQKPAKFLGYDVFIRRCNDLRKDKYGKTVRAFGHKPVLYLNFETMRKKLFDYKAARIAVVNGKEVWKSIVRTYMLNLDDLEIVSQFNAEIRGFYNYYSIANNSYVINSFYHIMSYSMYKVFANKYKSSVKKILLKYKKNKVFQVAYENSKGKTLYQSFYHDGFKRKKVAGNIYCDTIPRTVSITGGRNSLMERLKLQVCELCGATDKLEMHHVRKLKDLKGKSDWEKKMIARRRKTLANTATVKCIGQWVDLT